MQKIKQSCISFGNSRKNQYTTHQIKTMKDMKKAALSNGWCDIYTGEIFSPNNLPTIEHILPCSFKDNNKIKMLKKRGFQLNGLDNIFPAGSIGNSNRKSKPIKTTILDEPNILKRLFAEMDKYKKYQSNLIDGNDWVKRLTETLLNELSGINSDIKTRKIII